MAETAGPYQKLNLLARGIEAATGVRPDLGALVVALMCECPRGVRITKRALVHVNRLRLRQDLCNRAIRLSMRLDGPDCPYSRAYPIYRAWCRRAGVAPVGLKTFKNRAFCEFGVVTS